MQTPKRKDISEDAHMFTALSIAGSDSSGGAGIQADIKTMSAHGVYAMTAITALTAQNTMGVTGIQEVSPDFLAQQLDAVFSDIFPDAVKIGMVSSAAHMQVVAEKLLFYHARNIVVDPVMVSTSGSKLMQEEGESYLLAQLCPIADIITPNIPEAMVLTGREIHSADDMEAVALELYEKVKAQKQRCLQHCTAEMQEMYRKDTVVLLKGGHSISDANDLFIGEGKIEWIRGERIDNPNTHGTGCTLSSAIASNLAMGKDMYFAVAQAKAYISEALKAGLNLGHGSGPLNHMVLMK